MNTDTAQEACLAHLDEIISEMDDISTEALLDISAVAELVKSAPESVVLAASRARLRVAALRWLKAGVLAEIVFTKPEFTHSIALLVSLAREAPGFAAGADESIIRLISTGMIGRSELPTLSLEVAAMCYGQGSSSFQKSGRTLSKLIDKRILRRRTDEYDIATLIMVGHLVSADPSLCGSSAQTFPQVLLLDALRQGHHNYVAVLAFLNRFVFVGTPPALLQCAREFLSAFRDSGGGLIPPPQEQYLYSEFLERSPLGLQLRSTLACAAFLDED